VDSLVKRNSRSFILSRAGACRSKACADEAGVEDFFARTEADFLGLSFGDLRQVVEMALRQRHVTAAAG
jgi:hypothetical protein